MKEPLTFGKGKEIVECTECGVVGQGVSIPDLESRGWELINADNGFIQWSYWLCPHCSDLN